VELQQVGILRSPTVPTYIKGLSVIKLTELWEGMFFFWGGVFEAIQWFPEHANQNFIGKVTFYPFPRPNSAMSGGCAM